MKKATAPLQAAPATPDCLLPARHNSLQSRKARTRAAMAARREARLVRQAGGVPAELAAQRRRPLAPKRELTACLLACMCGWGPELSS